MRDFFKTIGAIVIIGLIVIATFLYGNRQRQEQLRRDQQAIQQKQSDDRSVTVDNSKNNTVVKPETTNPPTAPVAINQNVTATVPPAQTPDTGGEVYFLAPVALIAGLYQVHKTSKKNLRAAAISIR